MCGIVGFIGSGRARDVVIDGLKTLEYRGYDSAGAAFFNVEKRSVDIYKYVGRVNVLQENTVEVASHLGIGHTRWATHGKVTDFNAHPHASESGRFIIVHNGIIENYQALKTDYLNNVTFKSETDSEIISHLIEKFSSTHSVLESIIHTLKLLEGSYAVLVLDTHNPDVLYAAKNKPPLLIGRSSAGITITSDMLALVGVSDEYFVLSDKTLVEATNSGVRCFAYDFTEIPLTFAPVILKSEATTLGPYPHFMLKEINEQSSVIRHLLQKHFSVEQKVLFDKSLMHALTDADCLYILGAGTSMHAGLLGKSFFEKLAKKRVEVHIASEFSYDLPLLSAKPFFILITQSGETADLRSALQKIEKLGYRSLTITNVPTSTLAREATYFLNIDAAPEICVAATKTYIGQVTMLAMLAYALSDLTYPLAHELSLISQNIDDLISESSLIKEIVAAKINEPDVFFIGRGQDYLTSVEGSLKLKEISYLHSEAFPAGELKHGAIALISENTPVIALISDPATKLITRSNLSEVVARGACPIVVTTKSLAEEGDDIVVNDVDPLLSPLLFVVATQLIAYYAAFLRGLDIDKPRNLAKSVTVE